MLPCRNPDGVKGGANPQANKDERKLKAENCFTKRKGNGKRKRGNFVPNPPEAEKNGNPRK